MQRTRKSMRRTAVGAQWVGCNAHPEPARAYRAAATRESVMDDAKRAYRETEETAKEAWRKRDGEDLADKVGNFGDDVRKNLGNLGDDLVTDRPR
jgi:hypothetical protein